MLVLCLKNKKSKDHYLLKSIWRYIKKSPEYILRVVLGVVDKKIGYFVLLPE